MKEDTAPDLPESTTEQHLSRTGSTYAAASAESKSSALLSSESEGNPPSTSETADAVANLSAALASRERSAAALEAALIESQRQAEALTVDLLRARAHLQHTGEQLSALSDEHRLLAGSLAGRLIARINQRLRRFTPEQLAMLRRSARVAYWIATPHRTPARIRFLYERRRQQAADSEASVNDIPVSVQTTDRKTWFFIGDTLDWLNSHAQLSGVGKVTSELFAAAGMAPDDERAHLCVLGASPSGLVSISYTDTAATLASKLGKPALNRASLEAPGASSPMPGDQVLFTGVVWTPSYADLFRKLAAQGIGVNIFVYDIIPIEHPDLVGKTHFDMFVSWLETAIAYAENLFVSSESIRAKIIRWAVLSGHPLNARITPVDFGANDNEPFATPDALARHRLTAKVNLSSFVLSVGTIDRRKNQQMLARIWVRLIQDLGELNVPQLVLVGRDDIALASTNDEVAKLVASSKIIILQGLPDEELTGLYRACLFTAFPSLSEGYGLPVSESLQYGKVSVSSNLECIREHAGDFPWYFEANDENSAYERIRQAIVDHDARVGSERRIAQFFRKSSWLDSYRNMVGVLINSPTSNRTDVSSIPPSQFPGAKTVDVNQASIDAEKWCTVVNPDVSVLIINWNASALTLECIRQLWANTQGWRYEIVIVDNGSREEHVRPLRQLGAGIRLIELGKNRFFGEANNIAAEAATGRYVCLQNNDAFVQPGWLTHLISAFESDPEIGAVGPLFLFPDSTIQEAGAVIDENGYPVRFSRGQSAAEICNLKTASVDYISAACLLLPRDLYLEVGGFDLAYEPAYYEDVDLCFKIRTLGKTVRFCPDAQVIHIEGSAANSDPVAEARRNALGDLNRDKFVSRWGAFLKSRNPTDLERVRRCFIPDRRSFGDIRATAAASATGRKTAAILTPYSLAPGGGERYILTMASILAADHAVTIVTPQPYSNLRLRNFECEFAIDLTGCSTSTFAEFDASPAPDFMVVMGNNIVPPIAAKSSNAIFLCQFPFKVDGLLPPDASKRLAGYKSIIAYSEYSKAYIFAALSAHQLPPMKVHVVHPPVQQLHGDVQRKKNIILSVGRFFVGAHSKRHDLMIDAFRMLQEKVDGGAELHLAGSSIPEPIQMDYLNRLRDMAKGLDVHFHVNVSDEALSALYSDASIYWHAAGLGSDMESHPETAEHFGMSLVEAMSAGCTPLAFNAGGPREIIRDGESGYLYNSIPDLVSLTGMLLEPSRIHVREEMGRKAAQRSMDFSVSKFRASVANLLSTAA